jgi:TonB family protein
VSGNLERRDYRLIRSFGSPRGGAVLALTVDPTGRVATCGAAQSSGAAELDAQLCALLGRTRWIPARDAAGRPVTAALRYVATWDRN